MMKTQPTKTKQAEKVTQVIFQLMNSHKVYKEKLLPEIELLFLNAVKLDANEDVKYLYQMYQTFQSHFLHHMEEEERDLYPIVELAYERKNSSKEHVVVDEHTHIPENLLLAIINSVLILRSKRKELALATLGNKLQVFYEDLNAHSAIEDELFQLQIK